MRGASAESLSTLTEHLGRALEKKADANRVADHLFGVSDVLRQQPGLRRVVTDVSVDTAAKESLVRQLFGRALDRASLDLVTTAVGLRWANTRDLADALERLAVIAVVRGADRAGFADALEDELFSLARLVSGNPLLRDALSDPSRTREDKRALLRELLEGRVAEATLRLADRAIAGTNRTVSLAIEEYQQVAADQRSRLVATVRVARELDDQDRQRLARALERQYSRRVHLNVVVDREVIGGARVEIGGEVIDGTVASRLDEARRRLAG